LGFLHKHFSIMCGAGEGYAGSQEEASLITYNVVHPDVLSRYT